MTDVTDVQARTDTVTLTIDGAQITVPKGTLVIRAAEELGITVPRFCDHPLLDPIGACRQCMVEVEGQTKPFTSCTTTCTDGMVVRTHLASDLARKAQEGQLEFLLVNHPLDCPQCDKGGECPLQDQALVHGRADSRFVDDKRRYPKALPISASVALDRERCVLCARCTRFSQQISGDPFIELFERGALEQVAIYADEPYHSYFSGNVVQICPVGALTSTSYRFKSRPFDLRTADTVCNQCSAGCNLRADVRSGVVQRQLARDNAGVNESWSCDKGRYGYTYVAHPDRLREPLVRDELGRLQPATWHQALRHTATRLRAVLDDAGPGSVGVITGGRLTDEDAYAASRFARTVLGTDNVDFRLAPRSLEEQDVFGAVAGRVGTTYADVEAAPVVVLVGLDAEEEVPILHLRLRKAWRNRRQRILVVGPTLGGAAEYAWRWLRTAPGAEAQILRALAGGSQVGDEVAEVVRGAGDALVVLAGERLARSPGALSAAFGLAHSAGARCAWVPRRNGARGAVDAGLVPGLLPGGRTLAEPGPIADAWGTLPAAQGMDTTAMLRAAAAGELQALYLIGVDPARDFEDPRLATSALEQVGTLVVQDLMETETTRYADVLLPAQAPQERVGSFTTWEGRRQPFAQAVPPQGLAQQDWDILRQLARVLGTDLGWESAVDVRAEAAPLMDVAVSRRAPALDQRLAPSLAPHGGALPRAPGAATQDADFPLAAVVVEPLLGDGTLLAGADALKATARPLVARVNETDARRLGLADGDIAEIVGPAGRVALPVAVGAGVVPGAVVLPARVGATPISALAEAPGGQLRVRVAPVAGDPAA